MKNYNLINKIVLKTRLVSHFITKNTKIKSNSNIILPLLVETNSAARSWWQKYDIISVISNHLINYPTPINLTYSWSFGFLSGVALVIQLLSGLFLAMFYAPHVDITLANIDFIMREVKYGWFIRYMHSNGASMFFIVVYAHVFRGLYYGSYLKPRESLWVSGVFLLLILMATAFLGYVLPWGQMSFWGATVITSMFTIIPVAGEKIVECLWGGFVVNNLTLNRFYVFHFLFPFLLCVLVLFHLFFLHKNGSSAPVTDSTGVDRIPFYPYFFIKDSFAVVIFLLLFSFLVYFHPTYLSDPNNYIPADSIRTPEHIVPEWYFLPFYGMLRSIPFKVTGVLALFFSILILGILPLLTVSFVKDSNFRGIFIIFYVLFIGNLIFLTWLGQTSGKETHIYMGLCLTVVYFINIVVILPLTGLLELLFIFNRFKNNIFYYDHFQVDTRTVLTHHCCCVVRLLTVSAFKQAKKNDSRCLSFEVLPDTDNRDTDRNSGENLFLSVSYFLIKGHNKSSTSSRIRYVLPTCLVLRKGNKKKTFCVKLSRDFVHTKNLFLLFFHRQISSGFIKPGDRVFLDRVPFEIENLLINSAILFDPIYRLSRQNPNYWNSSKVRVPEKRTIIPSFFSVVPGLNRRCVMQMYHASVEPQKNTYLYLNTSFARTDINYSHSVYRALTQTQPESARFSKNYSEVFRSVSLRVREYHRLLSYQSRYRRHKILKQFIDRASCNTLLLQRSYERK